MTTHSISPSLLALVVSIAVLGLGACDKRTEAPPPQPTSETSSPPVSGSVTSAGQAVDDAVLTSRVKAALANDAGLKTLDLKVDSSAGVVSLSGIVATQTMRDNAIQVAQSVEGVRSVNNNLMVAQQ